MRNMENDRDPQYVVDVNAIDVSRHVGTIGETAATRGTPIIIRKRRQEIQDI